MLILDTEVETKGWVVRVTRKYSRMDRTRDMKGLDEEEQLLSAWVVGRSIVTSRAVDSIVSQRRLKYFALCRDSSHFHHCVYGSPPLNLCFCVRKKNAMYVGVQYLLN